MPSDYLTSVITISVGLAALASLITLFKSGTNFNEDEVYDFRGLVLSSLLISLAALFPFIASELLTDKWLWFASSAVYVVLVLIIQIQIEHLIWIRKYIVWTKFSLPLRIITLLVNLFVLINILVWRHEFPFLFGLFWALVATSLRLYIFLLSVTNEYSMPQIYNRSSNSEETE